MPRSAARTALRNAAKPQGEPDRLSAPALRTFFRIADEWELSSDEARTLLGSPPRSTFFLWKKTGHGQLGRDTLERVSPDFQTRQGYEIPAPGQANMSMSTTQLAERFGCVSMTLEMPFKDNFDLPDPVYGWSADRSKHLARACLDALHAILPELAKAKSEKPKAEKVDA